MGGVKFADFNDLESVKAQVTDKTCAIIMETVQGEGGIYPAEREFLEGVRALCDEKDILLILDEIQCGMGRSGYYFAWQAYGVQPAPLLPTRPNTSRTPTSRVALLTALTVPNALLHSLTSIMASPPCNTP